MFAIIYFLLISHGLISYYFLQTKLPGAMITSMEVNKANTTLFTADSFGFLCVWNIEGYCMSDAESEPPECKL